MPQNHIFVCPHMQENGLIKKLGLISKFVLSHTGKQIITIHILPNIPIIKGHQTMKVGLVIECIMRNIFCEKLYAKCGEEGIFRAFYKNLNWAYLRINLFLLYFQVNDYQIILKPRCWPFALTLHKIFWKIKKTWN